MLESELVLRTLPPYATESEIVGLVKDIDAILVRTCVISSPVVRAAPELKVVSRHGVGIDTVDVAECTRYGIAVAITEDANAQAVAEHAVTGILAVANKVTRADAHVRDGRWERH